MSAESAYPLISRKVLFGNPDKAAVRLSPDGTRISFIAPVIGVLNVWVGPAESPGEAKPVTRDTHRGIRVYHWAYSNNDIIYAQDKDGDEDWHIYQVNLATDAITDLTPYDGVHALVGAVSRLHPDEIVVMLNNRDKRYHDAHRVNLRTGDSTLVFENTAEFAQVLVDDEYRPRVASRFTPEARVEMYVIDADGTPKLDFVVEPEDSLSVQAIGFDKTGDVAYMLDGRGRNTAALVARNLLTGDVTVLGEDPRCDVEDVLVHPTERTIQGYSVEYTRSEWTLLDESVKPDWAVIEEFRAGDINIVSRTLDDSRWVVADSLDDGPTRYYVYDRTTRSATFLFTDRAELEDKPLARLTPGGIRSRHGRELVSYLSLPPGTDPDETGRPSEPVPLVLWVHGGPWARDGWGLNPVHQWLTNRGYAVLSVNYRGSTGLGKSFTNAGNREWAAKMHDDLIDAVEWAIAEGIAPRDKIAIGGGSYGGWATLVGVTFTPEVFACGVDIVGPSSLVTLLENVPEYWIPMLPVLRDRVGDHTTEEGRAFLTERSPLSHVDRIVRPLLIGQGANDPRVKQQESDQIVAAMKAKGIPVTYVLYSDEGHGFQRPPNRISFFAVAEAFLSAHLGGRYEPIGKDFEGSTIQVLEGADGVPGLAGGGP